MNTSSYRVHKRGKGACKPHAFVVRTNILTLSVFTLLLALQFAGPLGDQPWPNPGFRQTTVQVLCL